jgi:hypothetical protein
MFGFRKAFTVLALGAMVLWGGGAPAGPDTTGRLRIARTPVPPAEVPQPAHPVAVPQPAQPAPSSANPIGAVAILQGSGTVTRSSATNALKVKDAIFKGDVLQTA